MPSTILCDLLQIRHPILQGALGPYDTSDLALAVSRAGGLGVLSTDEADDMYADTRRQIQKLAKGTGSFGINVPVASPIAAERMRAIQDELQDDTVRRALRVVITSAGSPAAYARQLKEAGILHFHVVATVKHAQKAAQAGCAAVIAEGHESGGHVDSASGITTMALVPAVIDAVGLPVIAAGGFVDGPGLVAALALGAVGIQMGTRFYMTSEAAFARDSIKRALIEADVADTIVVPGTYGAHRTWRNDYTDEVLALVAKGASPGELARVKAGAMAERVKPEPDPRRSSVPIGMSIGRIRDIPTVEEVMRRTIDGAEATLRKLTAGL